MKQIKRKSKLEIVKAIKPPFVFGQPRTRIFKDGDILAVCNCCGKINAIAKRDIYSDSAAPGTQNHREFNIMDHVEIRSCSCPRSPVRFGHILGEHTKNLIVRLTPKYEFSLFGKRRKAA